MKKKIMQFLMSKGIYKIAYSGKEKTLYITVENNYGYIKTLLDERFPVPTFKIIYQTN